MSSRPAPKLVGLGSFAALPGAAIGFCGTFTYLLCLLLWQLNVDSVHGAVSAGLLPRPADWVTSLLYLTAYGLPSSAVLGAVLGLVVGWVLSRTTSSASAGLGWVFGAVTGFVIMLLLHLLLTATGLHVALGQTTRLLAVPMMIFVIDGGLLGVWLQQRRTAMIAEALADADRSLITTS